jgi:nucleotide-binding universal stress UspA family protein
MYSEILFPTDGSDESDAVLDHAIDLAKRYDATLEGLFVGDQRSYTGLAGDMDREQIREAQQSLGSEALDAVRSKAESEGVDVSTAQTIGIPPEEILETIETDDIDLVVMGTHGRTGIRRALLGSVAENVIRQSPVPIHLVPVGDVE